MKMGYVGWGIMVTVLAWVLLGVVRSEDMNIQLDLLVSLLVSL